MEYRRLALFFLFISLFATASAFSPFLEGYINRINLDKEVYGQGEQATVFLNLENASGFPIHNGELLFQLVRAGGEDAEELDLLNDRVYWEKSFGPVSLRNGEQKNLSYELSIPEFALPGKYRFDVFFRTERSFIIGMPFLYRLPRSASFEVQGAEPELNVFIDRNATVVCGTMMDVNVREGCFSGLVGVFVGKGAPLKISVGLKNDGGIVKDLSLKTSIYFFDDLSGTPVVEKIEEIGFIPAGKTEEIGLEFSAPGKPGPYSVRFELLDGAARVLSVYRERFNVKGEFGRIIQLLPGSLVLGENGFVRVAFAPVTDESLKEIDMGVRLVILKDGQEKFSEERMVKAVEGIPYRVEVFKPSFSKPLSDFELYAELKAGGKVIDSYSEKFPLDDFSQAASEFSVELGREEGFKEEASVFHENDVIFIRTRVLDELGNPIEPEVTLFVESKDGKYGPTKFTGSYEFKAEYLPTEYEFEFSALGQKVVKKVKIVAEGEPLSPAATPSDVNRGAARTEPTVEVPFGTPQIELVLYFFLVAAVFVFVYAVIRFRRKRRARW